MDYTDILPNYKDMLKVEEVAQILRVNKRVVYTMVKENKILAFKFGRQYKIPKRHLIEKYFLG